MNRRELVQSLREGPYTSLGSYPKFWLAADGSILSHRAIMNELRDFLKHTGIPNGDKDYTIEAVDINWEDPSMYCDARGERIPSAYAEPEEQTP